jgi:DNA-binding beta-propeller fold protein YncE
MQIEDIKYSPDGKYVLMADFVNSIIYISRTSNINHLISLKSEELKKPHGISFINDNLFVVANRHGSMVIYGIPDILEKEEYEINYIVKIEDNSSNITSYIYDNKAYILAMNNGNLVTKYTFDTNTYNIDNTENMYITNEFNLCDGITTNSNNMIIACSNHNDGFILLYKSDDTSKPFCYLKGPLLPHGICFTEDDKYLLVTDSASPFIFIFHSETGKWNEKTEYLYSKIFRVIPPEKFIQDNMQEGGPKGIDIKNNDVIISSQYQPYKLFNLNDILNSDCDIKTIIDQLSVLAGPLKLCDTFNRNWLY